MALRLAETLTKTLNDFLAGYILRMRGAPKMLLHLRTNHFKYFLCGVRRHDL